MKKLICLFFFNLILFFSQSGISQTPPTYQLVAKNFDRSAQDSIVFDIYILHTNPSAGNFEYSLGQYFFRFNPGIANGGTLTYRILSSDLPSGLRPRSPTVSGNELRLATNPTPGAGNGYIVSSVSPGTLVVKMSLKTSASGFSTTENLNITWKNTEHGNPYTKVFAYVGTVNTEITNPANHIIDKMVGVTNGITSVPEKYTLLQNYPNPFNPVTKIKFDLPEPGNVSLKVYDVSGRLAGNLINRFYNAGSHETNFSGANLASGIYFYALEVNGFRQIRKMTLLK